jgi:hypothetical protein
MMNSQSGGGLAGGQDQRGNVHHQYHQISPHQQAAHLQASPGHMDAMTGQYEASASPGGDARKRTKTSRACDECRRKKIKCNAVDETGDPPCGNCKRLHLPCLFSRQPQKRGPSKGYVPHVSYVNLRCFSPLLPLFPPDAPSIHKPLYLITQPLTSRIAVYLTSFTVISKSSRNASKALRVVSLLLTTINTKTVKHNNVIRKNSHLPKNQIAWREREPTPHQFQAANMVKPTHRRDLSVAGLPKSFLDNCRILLLLLQLLIRPILPPPICSGSPTIHPTALRLLLNGELLLSHSVDKAALMRASPRQITVIQSVSQIGMRASLMGK